MVSTPEKPPKLSDPAGGSRSRRHAQSDLCGSGFLAALRQRAAELGFSACRVTRPEAIPLAADHLSAFIGEGRHGDMDWLAERANWRSDPRNLWPEARSIIMLGMNYGPGEDPLAGLARRSCGNISVYARHRDYHDVV